MVDSVELVLCHEPEQVWKLHGDDSAHAQEHLHSANEVIDVRHVCEHVVTEQQIGGPVLGEDFPGRLDAKKLDDGWDTLLYGRLGHVCRWFDSQGRNTLHNEMLKQVAVIAGDLHYLLRTIEAEPCANGVHVSFSMRHPGVGVRRKVCIIGEYLRRRDVLL